MAHTGQFGDKQLKEQQKEIIKKAWGKKRPLVLAPAGFGKTLTALALFFFYKKAGHLKRCLVFAHSKGFEGYPKDNVFGFQMRIYRTSEDVAQLIRYADQVLDTADVHVVLTSVLDQFYVGLFPGESRNTHRPVLNSSQGISKLAPLVDFTILDEIHRYRTQENKVNHTLAQFYRAYRGMGLGMTATMFYTSALDTFQIMQYIDPNLFPNYWGFYEEFVEYRWKTLRQKRVENGRTVWKDVDIREKLGNKNMERLSKKLEPYLIEIKDERWTFHWNLVSYDLNEEENLKYSEYVGGLGLLDKLLKFTLVDVVNDKTKKLVVSRDQLVTTGEYLEIKGREVAPGLFLRIPKSNVAWMVRKIEEEDDEASISARLPVLQKFLSMTRNKVTLLYRVLQNDGALVYCQYHETAKALGEWAKKVWPDRKVSVLTGASTNVGAKIKGHDRSEIIFCTKAITESLNFYFHQIVIYESITNPGMLEQYVGRASRSDADYSDLKVFVFVGKKTIDAYFWERLLLNTNTLESNRFSGVLPHSPDWDWIKGYVRDGKVSFPVLKKLLLWRGQMGGVTDDDIAPASSSDDLANLRSDAGEIAKPRF